MMTRGTSSRRTSTRAISRSGDQTHCELVYRPLQFHERSCLWMLRCEQVPSAGDVWSSCRADNYVVVHVPNGGFMGTIKPCSKIKQNIGSAVTVEIGRSREAPAQRITWDPCRPHMNIVVHIPDEGSVEGVA